MINFNDVAFDIFMCFRKAYFCCQKLIFGAHQIELVMFMIVVFPQYQL